MGLKFGRCILMTILLISLSAGFASAKKSNIASEDQIAWPVDGFDSGINSTAQPGNAEYLPTEGTVVGQSTLDYATAYQGRSIAVGPDGTVHIVWCSEGEPNNQTWYVRSTDQGQTFSAPIMPAPNAYYHYKPSVAAHPTDPNIVVVAWVGVVEEDPNAGTTRTIHLSHSSDGGMTFGEPVPAYGTVINSNNPELIIDKNGNIYVAFDNYTDTYLRFNMSTDGGVTYLPEPEIVNLGSSEDCFGASLAMDANGNIHLLSGSGGTFGSWGDKGTYWNWRDNTIGLWMEIPWVEVAPAGTGLPYPSIVFDSAGLAHISYDNAAVEGTGLRSVFYRTMRDGSFSDAVEFPSDTDGGSTAYSGLAIDQYDNIYLMYVDGHAGIDLTASYGDIFTGVKLAGSDDWEIINFTGTGTSSLANHPNVAYSVVDSLLHLVYTGGTEGDYSIIHDIGYPWPPEPTIGVTGLSDTYNTTGPFTVNAITGDVEGFVTSAVLTVQQNGETIHTIDMTELEKDSYEATFSIDGKVGDVISYFGTATDNEGYVKNSIPVEFEIMTPTNPKADLLLIYDSVTIDTFYTHILDKLGYVYEHWVIEDRGGIDESVTTFGWSSIFECGWAGSTVPTRDYEGDPFAAFLQSGTDEAPKNLCVFDQDYFFGNGEPGGEIEFAAGDFAYDFFAIGAGTSDPDIKDNMIIGADDTDPIAGSFTEVPIVLDTLLGDVAGLANWIDWTEATGEGVDIFFAVNQGYGCGVRYDAGTFKTVHIPWMMSFILDSVAVDTAWSYKVGAPAYTLMQNILTWWGTDKGESGVGVASRSNSAPKAYSLSQNYPNPFNPETSIRYEMPVSGKVEIAIFNAVGQKIRTLVSNYTPAGSHVAIWDGRNDSGDRVSSGVYFYTLNAPNYNKTMKMVLIK